MEINDLTYRVRGCLFDKKQLASYLNITKLKIGLLVNFNVLNLQDGITRIVNKL